MNRRLIAEQRNAARRIGIIRYIHNNHQNKKADDDPADHSQKVFHLLPLLRLPGIVVAIWLHGVTMDSLPAEYIDRRTAMPDEQIIRLLSILSPEELFILSEMLLSLEQMRPALPAPQERVV